MHAGELKFTDTCRCGSGRRYGDCHAPIFEAPRIKAVPIAQVIYAKEWEVNAEHYQAQDIYGALARELAAITVTERVLDIGCGLGQGLEALSVIATGPGRLIIGVDENPACLERAAERLQIPTKSVASPRIKLKKLLSDHIGAEPALSPLKVNGDIVLIQTDLMVSDPSFEAFLDQTGPLDAITLWFSGVHKARSLTKVAQKINARSDRDLREALEDQVMEIAAKRLRSGGILQVVTRGAGDMENERKSLEASVREAVDEWPFNVVGVTAYPYQEPVAAKAITLGSLEFEAADKQHFALSILFRRNPDA